MATYRCPKHDRIFETTTDSRAPGSNASSNGKFPAHPLNGHPDCELCQDDQVAALTTIQPSRTGGARQSNAPRA